MTETDFLAADLASIDGWLQRNAPISYQTLLPGLNGAELAALEARYGFPLHPELRTLLSWHDGCTHSALAVQIWTDFMFEESAFMYESVQDFPDNYWDRHWVAFATDLGLKKLVVDHSAPPGRVMLFDGVDGMYEEPIFPSLGSLIAHVREALSDSLSLNGRRAVVEKGVLYWPEAV
jgi:cell wall assembly regulator SMI1